MAGRRRGGCKAGGSCGSALSGVVPSGDQLTNRHAVRSQLFAIAIPVDSVPVGPHLLRVPRLDSIHTLAQGLP
jgi:hypothetical protein